MGAALLPETLPPARGRAAAVATAQTAAREKSERASGGSIVKKKGRLGKTGRSGNNKKEKKGGRITLRLQQQYDRD